MKTYNKYKDSGIEWIGEIPNGWEISKIKYVTYNLVSGGTPLTSNEEYWTDSNEGISWVSIADMTKDFKIRKTNKRITKKGLDDRGLKLLPKGTLIYSIFATLGKVCQLEIEATTNQAILGIFERADKVNKDFLKYFLFDFEKDINSLSSSNTQENLNSTKVENIKILLPPLQEQEAITKYLDNKTQQIDKLIENTQNQIEELKEYEKSLINKCVTKGLNENVKLKDSGIEWIGEIPEDWEVKRIKNKYNVVTGATPSSSKVDFWEKGNILWATPNDLSKNKSKFISETERSITKRGYDSCGTSLIKKDNIILSTRAPIGYVTINSKELCFNQGCKALERKDKNTIVNFDYYSLKNFENVLQSKGKGTTFLELSTFELSNFKIPLPPLSEQKAIAQFLDSKTEKIQNLIRNREKQVELWQELKKCIINNAVTGKIKVT